MARIGRLLDQIYLLGAWLAGALLILLCSLILYSILARLMGWFAGGASDIAGYVMATSTFMALAYTFRTQGHIRVSLITQRFKGEARRGLEIWAHFMVFAISSFVAIYMTRLMLDSYSFEERSEGADAILLWIPQAPAALGSILFAISTFHVLMLVIFAYEQLDFTQEADGEAHEI